MSRIIKVAVLLISVFLRKEACAQGFLPTGSATFDQEIFVALGLEPELVTTIGYERGIGKSGGLPKAIGAAVKLDPLILRNKSYKWNVFGEIILNAGGNPRLLVRPQIYYAHLLDRAAAMDGIGFDLEASPFWEGKKWTKSFTLGWQHTAFTYIRHNDAAKQAFTDRYLSDHQQEPQDGWYKDTGNRFMLSFNMGRQLSQLVKVQFSFGSMAVLQRQHIFLGFSHVQVPFFIEGGIGVNPGSFK